MEAKDLSALILFENDFVAYKLSLTQHFSIVLIKPSDICVPADTALYYEAQGESPWNVIAVENFTLDEPAKRILHLFPEDISKTRLGVNKW